MEILARALEEGRAADPATLLDAIPYCKHLGITASLNDGALILVMPIVELHIGNVALPAIHGGVIGSLLETAALVQIIWETKTARVPKPVDITIDYLRSARAETSYARAHITKQGRKVINVHAQMWQADVAKPVAALRGHFLLA